jgi:hypothetical protein
MYNRRVTPGSDTTIYLQGMQLTGRRTLRPDEKTGVRKRRYETLWRGVLGALLAPVLLAAAGYVPRLLSDDFWSRLVFGISLYVLPLLGVVTFRSLVLAQRLRHDESLGEAELFSQTDDDGVTHHTERLPFSGMLWTINDKPTLAISVADSVPVANLPDSASVAAQWLSPAMSTKEKNYFANKREITPSEERELRRHQLHLSWERWRGLYAFDLYLVLVTLLSAQGNVLRGYDLLGLAAFGAALLALHSRAVRDLWTANSLARDIASRRLLIVRVERGTAESPIYEVLPRSGMPWSVNGAPASWRLGLGGTPVW